MEEHKSRSEGEVGSETPSDEMIEEVSDKYRLDFALLSPLKVSLYPAKSFPSVVAECGNRDSVLRLAMEEIEFPEGVGHESRFQEDKTSKMVTQQRRITSYLNSNE